MKTVALSKHAMTKSLSIFTVWLFQLSAIIGITVGFRDWFITKTPLNLFITATLLTLNFPIRSGATVGVAVVIFFVSVLLEWMGVHYEFLFGPYYYGDNLGYKVEGVPLLIGINWVVLVFCTAAMADRVATSLPVKIITGAALMVLIDFFIEVSAPTFDFWIWRTDGAPVRNYISWFVISAVLHAVYHRFRIKGDFVFALHLYLAQLVFFVYFYVFHLFR